MRKIHAREKEGEEEGEGEGEGERERERERTNDKRIGLLPVSKAYKDTCNDVCNTKPKSNQ